MKKDKGKLDELTNKPFAKIVEFNNASDKSNPEINRLILDGMHEAGFDENDETQSHAISDINRLTRRHLRDIYHAEDLRAKANTFDVKMSAGSLSDLTQNTIISLVRNDHIIEQMSSVKEIYNDIIRMLDPIKEQAKAISQAIENDVYDTRVDCCPTYWTLLKRFV